jgi:DNA-binding MarR family transcriptional regulator
VTLILARDNPSLTAGDVCRDLHHDSGAFTRILDHLEGLDLLKRERSETDRRVVNLHLTTEGRRTVDALLPLVVDRLNFALDDFSAAEVVILIKLLSRLIARLESPYEAPALAARKGSRP